MRFIGNVKLRLLAGFFLVAALFLVACGDATPTAGPSSSPTTVSISVTTVSGATSAAATTAASGTTAANSNLSGTLRLGFFPNMTHPQALIGIANGTFASTLGSGVKFEAKPFNAGPAAVEALLAGDIDMTYLGPNPAINAYVKTKGQGVRVIAGAASGGVSFVIRGDSNINGPKDLAGKKIATPQLGNTQDVALRAYIKAAGLQTADKGGTVEVVPTDNANILQLFENKQIDGAWVPEPWASRLVVEKKGRVLVDERTLWPEGRFVITHLLVSTKFLNEKPELVKAFLSAHVQITQDIKQQPDKARQTINDQLKVLTGAKLSDNVLNESFGRVEVLVDPIKSSLLKSADDAFAQGFLGKDKPNLDNLYDLKLLNQVLTEKGLPAINS